MEDWVTAANVAWATTYMPMASDVLVRQHLFYNCSGTFLELIIAPFLV